MCGADIVMTDMQHHQDTHQQKSQSKQQDRKEQPEDNSEFNAGQYWQLLPYFDLHYVSCLYIMCFKRGTKNSQCTI